MDISVESSAIPILTKILYKTTWSINGADDNMYTFSLLLEWKRIHVLVGTLYEYEETSIAENVLSTQLIACNYYSL